MNATNLHGAKKVVISSRTINAKDCAPFGIVEMDVEQSLGKEACTTDISAFVPAGPLSGVLVLDLPLAFLLAEAHRVATAEGHSDIQALLTSASILQGMK